MRSILQNIRRAGEIARLRRLIVSAPAGRVRLHLGCGDRLLPGWINMDLHPVSGGRPDVLLDLSLGLPAPDACADLIFSEDVIEHLDREAGRRLLRDCARSLKPGGVMRLLTPNLAAFVQAFENREAAALDWYRRELGCETFGDMLNAGMRAWGHQFLYDEETLLKRLDEAGFDARRRSFGESDEPELRGLDSRNTAEGSLSMYFDCYRRGKA